MTARKSTEALASVVSEEDETRRAEPEVAEAPSETPRPAPSACGAGAGSPQNAEELEKSVREEEALAILGSTTPILVFPDDVDIEAFFASDRRLGDDMVFEEDFEDGDLEFTVGDTPEDHDVVVIADELRDDETGELTLEDVEQQIALEEAARPGQGEPSREIEEEGESTGGLLAELDFDALDARARAREPGAVFDEGRENEGREDGEDGFLEIDPLVAEETSEETAPEIVAEIAEEDAAALEEIEEDLDEELSLDEAGEERDLAVPRACLAIGLLTAGLLTTLFVVGWSYYKLPMARRPFHFLHDALRPSGTLGLPLGVAGTLFTVASLGYLLRKRFLSLRRWGTLRGWMGFHVFAGFMGLALVAFHAAFVPYSAIGMFAFSAMVIVMISGIVGRYIFVFFPRTLEGRELEYEDVRRRLLVYRKRLIELGVDPAVIGVDIAEGKRGRSPWLLQALGRVLYGDWQSRRELKRLREAVGANESARVQTHRILLLIDRLCRERQWLVRYRELRKLMGAWRFLHRWLAIVMFLAVVYHILIGVNFGSLWIFGGGH